MTSTTRERSAVSRDLRRQAGSRVAQKGRAEAYSTYPRIGQRVDDQLWHALAGLVGAIPNASSRLAGDLGLG